MTDSEKIERGYKIAIWHIPSGDLVLDASVHERAANKIDQLIKEAILGDMKSGKPRLKLED